MVKCWLHFPGLPVCSSQACCSTSSSPSQSWKTPSWFQHLPRRWNLQSQYICCTVDTCDICGTSHTLSVWGDENMWYLPSFPTLFYSMTLAMATGHHLLQAALCKPTWPDYFLWLKINFTPLYLLFFKLLSWNLLFLHFQNYTQVSRSDLFRNAGLIS